MNNVLPVFLKDSFDFGDNEPPPHIDDQPSIPSYTGLFEIFGAADGTKPYTLAVDIQAADIAIKLAIARERQQERDIAVYGYTDDVYILFPDGTNERIYIGRWLEE